MKRKIATLLQVLVVAALVLLVPGIIRHFFFNSTLVGEQSYYSLRAAQSSTATDSGAYYPKPFFYTPYDYLLRFLSRYLDTSLLSRAIPYILGILSVIFFYLILSDFELEEENLFYVMLLLVISPIFIYTFSVSNPDSLAVLLLLVGSWLLMQKNSVVSALSALPFLLASYTVVNSVLVFVVLISYYLLKKEKAKLIIAISVFLVVADVLLKNPLAVNLLVPGGFGSIQQLISDFGGLAGFSIFALIFFFAGIFSFRRDRLKNFYPLFAFFIVSFFVAGNTTVYANWIVSLFAGIGFTRILKIKWKIGFIRDMTLLILVCGLLFSTVSYLNILGFSSPSRELSAALDWAKANTPNDAVFFSHYSNGVFIEQVSGRKVLLDSMSAYGANFEQALNDSESLFYSRNLNTSESILQKYGISYVLITPEMKQGLVWQNEDEGLLFILTNKERFKKAYSRNGVDVWEYTK